MRYVRYPLALLAITALSAVRAIAQPAPAHDARLDSLHLPVRYERVFGARIAYYETGRGPTLILLPNLGWDSHSWAANVPALARRYHVVAVDPLGFGRSDKPLIDYKMNTWTDVLDEFMRVRGIPRATFIGAVMGGALSVQMALDHPERVEALVVAASNSGPGPHEGAAPPRGPSGPSLAGVRAGLLDSFFDSTLVTEALVRARFAYRLRADDGYVMQRHLADHRVPYTPVELSAIQVPALFVWCREDRVTPLPWGEQYAAAVRGARLATLDRCGHLPNLEQPEAFNRAVLGFLDGLHHASPGSVR
jgi:pimeloyl-ACP methyl ester carboxylesterase